MMRFEAAACAILRLAADGDHYDVRALVGLIAPQLVISERRARAYTRDRQLLSRACLLA